MIRLAYLEDKYIKFLRKTDSRVMFNKGSNRPYIGIVFKIKNHNYYAPLSGPKDKHKTMKNSIDFMRIDGGKLGAINFNNMIPVVDSAIKIIKLSEISDMKYKLLLSNQIKFLNKYETEIVHRATKLYKNFKSRSLRNEVYARCCNFSQLEKISRKYDPNWTHNPVMQSQQTNVAASG